MTGALLGPRAVASATAPVRVADVGGWTDTWFAERGAVCSVAVGPGARAEVVRGEPSDGGPAVTVAAPDLGAAWTVDPDRPGNGAHPLIDEALRAWVESLPQGTIGGRDGASLRVTVSAAVPPGSSVGTSASVLVALVAALDALAGRPIAADAVARAAHAVETSRAGRESGVQDHVAAAHGGASWIEVDPYPTWERAEVELPAGVGGALTRRLLTVHLGGGHDSSALHRAVIERAEAGDREVRSVLAELRALATAARDRLGAGDLEGWAAVLTGATEQQARLHPALVGADARAVAELARAHGAAGWKVNGAGGPGGTVTVVGPDDPDAGDRLRRALTAADPAWRILDLTPAGGVQVDVG